VLSMRRCRHRKREGKPGAPPVERQKRESLIEEEEEKEITPPSLYPLCITLPQFNDIVSQQVGNTIGDHLSKCNQTGTGSSTDSPQQFHLSLVTSDQKWDEQFAPINGTDPPISNFIGPIKFGGCRGHHGHDSGGILVESQGSGAPAQEGQFWNSPAGVLPVCVRSRLSLT
jgi:hypothetical protein